jgi:Fe-S cluster assembly protein SufD
LIPNSLNEQDVAAISGGFGEADWLRDNRLAAAKIFTDVAWPDSSLDEFWRSTPFQRIKTDLALVTGSDAEAPAMSLEDASDSAVAVATIVDGALVTVDVPAAMIEQGVVVTSLDDEAHAALVGRRLTTLTSGTAELERGDRDKTVVLNDAAWTAGLLVFVPAEVEVDAPIVIRVHVATPGTHLPRVLIEMGHHARATVVLEHTSVDPGDQRVLVSEVVEAFCGDASMLKLVSLQDWTGPVDHLALHKGRIERNARFDPSMLNFGGRTVRMRPESDLIAAGGETFPSGVYAAAEGQWFDMQPYVRHVAPRCTSNVLFKGSLQGHSRTVFRGNVLVEETAIGTVTDENNRTLILTDGARADATPFLEIYCSDITAGHGSATGQIDARALFYLEARGIPRPQAIRLIVVGFFRDVLERIQVPIVDDRVMALVESEVSNVDLSRLGIHDVPLAADDE